MSSSTVLRVKRRLEDNPQDALVLMCKRLKTDNDTSPSLFVFKRTVEDQETSNVRNIVAKTKTKLSTPRNVSEIIDKIRKERREAATENRYEVVNCSRGLKDNDSNEESIDLVDLQQKIEEDATVEKYAYDLYVAAIEDFDISLLDNLVSIENYESNLIYGSYRDNGGTNGASSDEADDDDDSNDENNWRNDYPDSEPSSIDEEDMVRAMEKINMDDDLSSDTGEDKIYDEPPDLFNEDVKRYGAAYAAYKARVLSEVTDSNSKGLIHSSRVKDMDEESIEGYKDDSDGFYYGEDEDTDNFKRQYGSDTSDEYNPD